MASLCQVQLIGNLGRDPEMNYTPNGVAVTKFSIAVEQGYGDKKTTAWWSVIVWGTKDSETNQATRMNEWLYKGCKVFVQGSPEIRKYTGRDGIERTSVEVRAAMVEILSSREQRAKSTVPPDDALGDLDENPF